jgi:signal transduction histidine kinase
MKKSSTESFKMLNSLSEKLFHISEIVELQQRFVGELGTENMTKLSQVIKESITIFDESFNKYGYKINTKLDKNIPEVLVDSSMLTQVFINFIKNAIEAMTSEANTSKKYKLDIGLKSKKHDDKNYANITIKDNGPGIPDDIKDEVFNFGFSTKTGENSSSRGIGLHFSKDCIKKYGGFIEMSSKVGKGCSFEIYIPIAKQD